MSLAIPERRHPGDHTDRALADTPLSSSAVETLDAEFQRRWEERVGTRTIREVMEQDEPREHDRSGKASSVLALLSAEGRPLTLSELTRHAKQGKRINRAFLDMLVRKGVLVVRYDIANAARGLTPAAVLTILEAAKGRPLTVREIVARTNTRRYEVQAILGAWGTVGIVEKAPVGGEGSRTAMGWRMVR